MNAFLLDHNVHYPIHNCVFTLASELCQNNARTLRFAASGHAASKLKRKVLSQFSSTK